LVALFGFKPWTCALVLRVLEPIWHEKTEAGDVSAVRGRIEQVLGFGPKGDVVIDMGREPARLAWHTSTSCSPHETRYAKVRHHPALPYL
jgi:hypothetical protein